MKLLGLDLASLATQGVGAGAQPNAYTGYGIERNDTDFLPVREGQKDGLFVNVIGLTGISPTAEYVAV